ncbi:hypothetical protein FA04_30005 (plasmid) [Ensifer adhaerens]|nr:hypothetical protein FA04_30005 [Ensifer adhaerens]KQX25762.1 hypothetical protein ASD01_24995 [Ensifer sp. Root423]
MKANMILPIARGDLIAIGDKEHVRSSCHVVVASMQENGKTTSPSQNVGRGDGSTIATCLMGLAARQRIGPAGLCLVSVRSDDSD